MKFHLLLYIAILLILSQCTKEITLNVPYEPETIIFGTISQEAGPVLVNIQQSVPLNSDNTSNPINDAQITLYTEDTLGNTAVLTDSFTAVDGLYTSTDLISPLIGNYYWIAVVLDDGTQFLSEKELLKPVVPITEVMFFPEDDNFEIHFSDPENDTNFYNYKLDLFLDGSFVASNRAEANDVVFDGSSDALVEIGLYTFDDDEDLDIEFDEATITLENINYPSYQFYLNQSFQILSNDDGSGGPGQLFATPPVNIEGNIMNTTENRKALGNFTVKASNAVTTVFTD